MPSSLYRRLLVLRWALPIFLCLLAQTYLILVDWPSEVDEISLIIPEILFYAVLGPLAVWLIFRWLARRVHERDEAESYLNRLYHLSLEIALNQDVRKLVEIGLSMP